MLDFPHAKINLGLRVLDGPAVHPRGVYHDIETVLVPVSLRDALEIVPSTNGTTTINTSGTEIPSGDKPNLCLQAYRILDKALHSGHAADYNTPDNTTQLPPVHIWLHKNIPPGSGLGGGSSNAAYTLNLLNNRFKLNLSKSTLYELTGQLGSDCPFFLEKYTMLATGRGDILHPIHIDGLGDLHLLILIPPVRISTARAYRKIRPASPAIPLTEALAASPATWKQYVVNDFEHHVFAEYPVCKELKDFLYGQGAVFASLTGTGSAVFGLFHEPPETERIKERFPEVQVVPAVTGV